MNLSPSGFDFIKSFEGYHKKLPNGDCTAYLCPANVWTIGFGCTEGVKPGMVWTAQQAEEALRAEVAKFEAGVNKLVKVPLSQAQFDALVSFTYNVGLGAFTRSGLLAKLNARNYRGAVQQFALWNRGGGRVLPGLVRRRAAEAALFASSHY